MAGVPILSNVASGYRLLVEFAPGADLTLDEFSWPWTDITTDVMQDNGAGVTITIGRANEASVAQPASCTFRLKNRTGLYTPANPGSAYYPNIRLGTPIRVSVSVDGGSNYTKRFLGLASSWSPGWDGEGRKPYVTVTASGLTRKLGSGSKPLRSAMYRSITTNATAPLAYWSLEEGVNTTQFASGVAGVSALPFFPTGGQLSTIEGPAGSAPLIDHFNLGPYPPLDDELIYYPVTTGGNTYQSVEFVAYVQAGSSPTASSDLWAANWTSSGTYSEWHFTLAFDGSGPILYYLDGSGFLQTALLKGAAAGTYFDSQWHHYRMALGQSGGNIAIELFIDGVSAGVATLTSATLGHITAMLPFVDPNDAGTMHWSTGHLALYGVVPPDNMPAFRGHIGETADSRLSRLCAEEGVSLDLVGTSATTMGVQAVDTFLNLLRECESADLGLLVDGLSSGLTYICRSALYGQAAALTINANSGQVPATGPLPTLDDQRIINRATVTNTNGSTITVEDEDGSLGTAEVGVFDGRYVVNIASDSDLPGIGEWLVHIRTPEGMRYPQVQIDFAAAPELASSWVSTVPTNRLDLTNLSSKLTQHPPQDVSLLIEGWGEVLNARMWRVAVNCSSYQPWNVYALTTNFPLELDGQTLSANLVAGATTLSLATAGGKPLFTTSAGDFPLDLNVGGWPIHVTNATGSSSPQTLTITASPNTSTVPSGTEVTLWRSPVLAL